MDTPLTLGMSGLLYFEDETFKHLALGDGATLGTKEYYRGYSFFQKDPEAGSSLLNNYDTPHIRPSQKTEDSDCVAPCANAYFNNWSFSNQPKVLFNLPDFPFSSTGLFFSPKEAK